MALDGEIGPGGYAIVCQNGLDVRVVDDVDTNEDDCLCQIVVLGEESMCSHNICRVACHRGRDL
jgi:hypothetical protein